MPPKPVDSSMFPSQSGEIAGARLLHSVDHTGLLFGAPRPALSSACFNGGFTQASAFINLRVASDGGCVQEDPVITLQRASLALGCEGTTVGMMTAASMKSLRVVEEPLGDETLAVMVTTGMDNARRAGDPAEHQSLRAVPGEVGTINLAVLTSAALSQEAMVEALMLATEAKAAVLQELGVTSPVSGKLATGTGTDASVVFAGFQGEPLRFVGKHTLFGERLANVVMAALRASLQGDEVITPCV